MGYRSVSRSACITICLGLLAPGLFGQTSAKSSPASQKNAAKQATPSLSENRDLRLVEAVEKKDKEAIRALLKQHINVNTAEGDGSTALSWAVYLDDIET